MMEDFFNSLSPMEQNIIELWAKGHTLAQIATSTGLSIERARRELKKIQKLIVELYKAPPSSPSVVIAASEATWTELIAFLSRNPEQLYALPPRKFEELVAELLSRDGMDVQLTPPIKDGGRDILAFSNTPAGRQLYLVECKRYSKENPIDVSIVRSLYGVVEAERATSGLLVTTSFFTKGAVSFIESVKYRLSKKDHDDLAQWLKNASVGRDGT